MYDQALLAGCEKMLSLEHKSTRLTVVNNRASTFMRR
jgi:hypothetical protein